MKSSEIADLKNLGGKTESWLNSIGVYTRDDLRRLGSIEIYRLLKAEGLPASLNLVYGIEGALQDIDWRELPANLKAELKREVQNL